MTPLTIRRILVCAVSMLLGALITLGILVFFLPAKNPSPDAGVVSIGQYGIGYFIGTTLAHGMILVTLFDQFMDTRLWPD